MATDALVTDLTAEKHVEEIKVGDDIKHVDEESVSQPMDLEGKDEEEKLKVEDSADVAASVTEQENKPEDEKSDTLIEEVKEEEAEEGKVVEKESESEAVEKPEENLEASLVEESKSEAAKESAVSETMTEEVQTEELPSASEIEDKATESPISTVAESASDVTAAPDACVSAEISQDEKALAEKVEVGPESSMEEPSLNEISVQGAAASDSSYAIAIDHAEANELKDAGAVVPEVPDVPEMTDANLNADDVVDAGAVVPDVPEITDANLNADNVDAGVVVPEVPDVPEKTDANLNADDVVDAGAVVPEVPDVPEKTDANLNADEVVEESVKVESGNDETEVLKESIEVEEKAMEGEVPTLSETSKTNAATEAAEVSSEGGGVEKVEEKGESLEGDKTGLSVVSKDLDAATEVSTEGERASEAVEVVEEKDESLEGDKTTLVETSRDLDVVSTAKEPVSDSKEAESDLKPAEAIQTVTDKLVSEGSEDKKDESEKGDDAKDGGVTKTEDEAPKQEVLAKPSQRQSNNLMSKVKQSIVKVKKAIIGKSPSSKMSSEGKDDIKVK